MKQWQVIQHTIDDKDVFSLSLIDMDETGKFSFIMSIGLEPTEKNEIQAVRFADSQKQMISIPADKLSDFILTCAKEYNWVVGIKKID